MRMSKDECEWRAQEDLRTLVEAQKIRNDKGRLKAAMAQHKKQLAALNALEK